MYKVLLVFGTRPEAIELAPVVKALRLTGTFEVRVCVTAQHRQRRGNSTTGIGTL